ncbi:MAG: hypothetical protein K2L77_02075, partial [Muribaculaceae bacterium]|nr:hypothetical protein [Muribaculaceae bacterium]
MIKKLIPLFLLAITASGYLSAQGTREMTPEQKLQLATAVIERYYVEEVDADTIVQEAIIAMLKT